MKILEFAEKYGVSRRAIDYWTDLDLLHPEIDKENGYRDYADAAEEEILNILILQAMGLKITKENQEAVKIFTSELINLFVLPRMDAQHQLECERYEKIRNMVLKKRG